MNNWSLPCKNQLCSFLWILGNRLQSFSSQLWWLRDGFTGFCWNFTLQPCMEDCPKPLQLWHVNPICLRGINANNVVIACRVCCISAVSTHTKTSYVNICWYCLWSLLHFSRFKSYKNKLCQQMLVLLAEFAAFQQFQLPIEKQVMSTYWLIRYHFLVIWYNLKYVITTHINIFTFCPLSAGNYMVR